MRRCIDGKSLHVVVHHRILNRRARTVETRIVAKTAVCQRLLHRPCPVLHINGRTANQGGATMSGNPSVAARAESVIKGASARRTLEGVSKRDRPHLGLLRLNQAARLAGSKEKSIDEVSH